MALRRHLVPLAILAVLPILMLLPGLLPGENLLPAQMLGNMLPWHALAGVYPSPALFNPLQFDGIAQFYPWRLFAANTLKAGSIPLWNPYQFCGTPFLANDQSAVLYPLNLLFIVFPVAKAFGVSAVVHLFLTGSFVYAFMIRRVSVLPALLAAVIWQLSAWQISWLALPTFLCTSTWIPLALLQVERCAEQPITARGMTLGAILGIMLLAGHLQVAFYGLLITGAYALTFLVSFKSTRAQFTLACLSALAIMVLISAPQMLPTIELARVSHRSGAAASLAGYAGYVRLAMPLASLVTLVDPSFFGRSIDYWGATNYAENACFVSVVGLLLALMAVTRLFKESSQVRFLAIVAGIALLLALGTPLDGLLYFGIPGFGQTGSPARVLVLWTLCCAILAGHGFDALLNGRCPKAAIWWVVATAILTTIGTILWLARLSPNALSQIDITGLVVSGVLLLAAIGVVVWAHSYEKVPPLASGVIALVCVAELFRATFGYNLPATDAQVYPVTPAISWLQSNADQSRILAVNDANAVYESSAIMPPNSATVYGLLDVAGYDSLQTKQYKGFLNEMNGGVESSPRENGNMALTHEHAADSADAALAGVRYVLSPKFGAADATGGIDAGMSVLAQNATRPLADVVGKSGIVEPAEVSDPSPNRVVVVSPVEGDLTISDQWIPGWVATVNGRPAEIIETPSVFRTIRNVPARAVVEMRYQPDSFRVGLYLAGIALACLSASALAQFMRRAKT